MSRLGIGRSVCGCALSLCVDVYYIYEFSHSELLSVDAECKKKTKIASFHFKDIYIFGERAAEWRTEARETEPSFAYIREVKHILHLSLPMVLRFLFLFISWLYDFYSTFIFSFLLFLFRPRQKQRKNCQNWTFYYFVNRSISLHLVYFLVLAGYCCCSCRRRRFGSCCFALFFFFLLFVAIVILVIFYYVILTLYIWMKADACRWALGRINSVPLEPVGTRGNDKHFINAKRIIIARVMALRCFAVGFPFKFYFKLWHLTVHRSLVNIFY